MRNPAAAALCAAILLATSGCGGRPEGLTAVRPGMSKLQVERAAGPPLRRETGDFAHLGQDVWHYADGEVHFYMNEVSKVRFTGRPDPKRKPWERRRQPWEMR